jgi:hypothetical protein
MSNTEYAPAPPTMEEYITMLLAMRPRAIPILKLDMVALDERLRASITITKAAACKITKTSMAAVYAVMIAGRTALPIPTLHHVVRPCVVAMADAISNAAVFDVI